MTGFCHHLLRLEKTHLLVSLYMIDFLGCIEFTGADTHECDPVSMCLVHVCLDLEYECGKIIRHRIDLALIGYSRKWRGCHLEEVLKESLHTEVCKRGTEEYRCHISLAYLFLVKFHTCSVQKLDLIHELFLLIRIYDVVKSCIVNIDFFDHTFLGSLLCVREGQDFVCISVINSTEFLTGTDRPVDRAGCDPEFLFYFIQKIKRIICISVHLVDKSKDRNVSHDADLEQLSCLCLDTLASVDDHDCGIRCHQSTVGIL